VSLKVEGGEKGGGNYQEFWHLAPDPSEEVGGRPRPLIARFMLVYFTELRVGSSNSGRRGKRRLNLGCLGMMPVIRHAGDLLAGCLSLRDGPRWLTTCLLIMQKFRQVMLKGRLRPNMDNSTRSNGYHLYAARAEDSSFFSFHHA
jgi:hypothetical protein